MGWFSIKYIWSWERVGEVKKEREIYGLAIVLLS